MGKGIKGCCFVITILIMNVQQPFEKGRGLLLIGGNNTLG